MLFILSRVNKSLFINQLLLVIINQSRIYNMGIIYPGLLQQGLGMKLTSSLGQSPDAWLKSTNKQLNFCTAIIYKSISLKASESQMLQMVKLKLLDSNGGSLESIDLGTMITLKIGYNSSPDNYVSENLSSTRANVNPSKA